MAQLLAESSDEPEVLLVALEEREAAPDVLLPFLDRAAELQRPGWEASLKRLLSSDSASWVAIRVALTQPCEVRLKRLAIEQAGHWLRLIDTLVLVGQIDHPTLALLFDAPAPSVRRQAAVTIGSAQSGRQLEGLPRCLFLRWREVIENSPADDAYWLSRILDRDDDLCADWLRAWFKRHAQGEYDLLPQEVAAVIADLPVEARITLIGDVPAGAPLTLVQEAVRSLVAEDLDVMVALFDRPELEWLHSVALYGGPSEAWMDRALLALDRGWGTRGGSSW